MARPGVTVTKSDIPPGRGSEARTGAWFVAGLTEKGPTEPTTVYSNGEFRRVFGGLVGFSVLPDAVEDFFAERGSHVVVSRVVGDDAKAASKAFAQITVHASSVGEWGNDLDVEIDATLEGETVLSYVVIVTDDDGNVLEQSPSLETNAQAVTWGETAEFVTVTSSGSTKPGDTAATSLTGGTDDRAEIGNADWQDALAAFDADLGPGQVSTPGRSGEQAFADLFDHGDANNRIPYLDVEVTDDTSAELKAKATLARSLAGDRVYAIFGPWSEIPGVAVNTTRSVPASGAEAAKVSRNDAETGNPNLAAAGDRGVSEYAVGLVAEITDPAERDELNDAGLNLIRVRGDAIKTYGFRTGLNKVDHPNDWQLANARLTMAIVADAQAIGEEHLFRQIDGKGLEISRFHGDLEIMLDVYWKLGALFGGTPAEAYSVNTGPDVNTVESLSNGELLADLGAKRSPFAEQVQIDVAAVHPTATV